MHKMPKLTRQNLQGVCPALIIPWSDDDSLDQKRFTAECRSYAGTGVDGIYTGGTTGEFYTHDDETFELITHIACESAHAIGLPVQIGCTTLSTRTACQRVRLACKTGADAIQIAYPFWLKLQPDEVLGFRVISATGVPESACHKANAIWAWENRFFFMRCSLLGAKQYPKSRTQCGTGNRFKIKGLSKFQ